MAEPHLLDMTAPAEERIGGFGLATLGFGGVISVPALLIAAAAHVLLHRAARLRR